MTAPPAWTPAPRPGLIPLHPLSFGTILGRSFAALRQNPRVLLGFALIVQTLAYVVVLIAVGAVAFASFSRLGTLREGTDDYNAVLAGSLAITIVAGVVLGLAAGALSVIVQGVVVTEVAHAAVAERLPLRSLWAQVRPVVWRLLGYALVLSLAIAAVVGVIVLAIVAIGAVVLPLAVAVGVFIALGAVPLYLWLGVKLVLVPATIVLEHARVPAAIGRSWQLTRGRFWSTLGVIVIIAVGFNIIAQVVSFPFSIFGSALAGVVSPTGSDEASGIIGFVVVAVLTQVVTLLIQSVALVVQATASSLIYIDCRMRHEGLDLDLLAYVEHRDAGATALPDPYRVNVGRAIAPRPPVGYPAPYPPYGAAPGYPPIPPQSAPPYPAYPPASAPVPPYPAAPPAYPPAPPGASSPGPSPTQWAAPGGRPDDPDPRSP